MLCEKGSKGLGSLDVYFPDVNEVYSHIQQMNIDELADFVSNLNKRLPERSKKAWSLLIKKSLQEK